ncbi:hypothetical protein QPK31_25875 [Massilia sp. YIM B02769]|uniref:hypothetical protein n=1 Tax=Massilia sp. YIM B02769 TaxID=3050129 RepID=UPI0025B687EC|nr:hypothetical protein [Massilia sp. YIM B02769]MDN4061655.1 hypothetical protein [Massilia sp. YIM B02769]
MTDPQFLAWLQSSAAYRCVLIEAAARVNGVETMVYMATKAFTTSPADSPANTQYLPIATVGTLFTERLSLEGDGALSAGNLEIDNTAGVRDAWAGAAYVWKNREIRAYIGDIRWPRSDFRMIFNGIVADIAPSGRSALLLKLRDKLQRLNTAITEVKLGGETEQKDALLPFAIGQVSNITPLPINPATLTYGYHCASAEGVIANEARDNGAPVAMTSNPAAGTVTLESTPAGAVTLSIKGDNGAGYCDTAATMCKRLATGYGKAADRFTAADLDLANIAAFDAAHPQPMGLYSTDRLNVLAACQMLLGSIGAQLVMSRLGLMRLIQVALPGAGTPFVIRPEHMVDGTLQPAGRTDVVGAVKLGFAKNWTVQDAGTLANLPEVHKALFTEEWLTTTKTDAATLATYRLNAEPVQVDTMLLTRADADAEAQRRLDLWKVPRTTYDFDGVPELLQLELGQAVTVYSPRFGMDAGVSGIVISLAPDWNTGRVKVGFLV